MKFRQKFGNIEGFPQELPCSCIPYGRFKTVIVISGHEHNGEVQETPRKLPRQSDPVHPGHIKVCDHGVKPVPFTFLKGLNTVFYGFTLMALI